MLPNDVSHGHSCNKLSFPSFEMSVFFRGLKSFLINGLILKISILTLLCVTCVIIEGWML